jgi:hypothetical protein
VESEKSAIGESKMGEMGRTIKLGEIKKGHDLRKNRNLLINRG